MKGTSKDMVFRQMAVSMRGAIQFGPLKLLAKYLRELYEVFQSWDLALAAYNCGEHRVLGAVMRGGTRDFGNSMRRDCYLKKREIMFPNFGQPCW